MTGSFHSRPESSLAFRAIQVAYQQRSASSPSPCPLQLHRVGAALKVCQVFPDCNWETTQLNCCCSWQLLANNFWRAWEREETGTGGGGTEWALSLSYGMSSMSTFMVFPLWIVLQLPNSPSLHLFVPRPAGSHSTGNWQLAARAGHRLLEESPKGGQTSESNERICLQVSALA